MTHYADDTEILSKLGILNSRLECPNRMKGSRVENRRVRAALNMPPASTSSLSDDSDDEIVFDRNALLNARKRRRRHRSYSRISSLSTDESTKWRLFCLSCTFFCMGLATAILGLTSPDIMANVQSTQVLDYAHIFVYAGLGYLLGCLVVSLIFTRLNAYLCLLFLLGVSIPFTVLVSYQTDLSNVHWFLFCQGLLFGAIERGAHLMLFGIWKGNKRILFMFYMSLAIGGSVSSLLTTETVFSRTPVVKRTHEVAKREISSSELPTFKPPTLVTEGENGTATRQAVTRPSSAVGINEGVDTKTKENEQRRKQAQAAKTKLPTGKCANGTECTSTQSPATTRKTTSTTTPLPTTHPTSASPNRATELTPPVSIVDQVKKNIVEHVKGGLGQVGSASQLAYLLVMALMLVTVVQLILGFCACCIDSNLIADARIAQLELDAKTSHPIPPFVQLISFVCWFLGSLPESIALVFLPHFVSSSRSPDLKTQNSAAFFNGVFWISVAVFRSFVAIRPTLSTSTKLIKFSYASGIPICFVVHQTAVESEVSLCVGLISLGFLLISMPLLTYSWLQQKLNTSPYLLSRGYLTAVALSKITAPLLVVRVLSSTGSIRDLLGLIAWISVLSFFCFLLLLRSVNPLARHWQIHELSGDINGRRAPSHTPSKSPRARKGVYQALVDDAENNQSDADVEMDYVQAERGILSDSSNSI